jgi:hypothetical protein
MSRSLAEETEAMAILEAIAFGHYEPERENEEHDSDHETDELFCTCRQPAYGDMIACENDDVRLPFTRTLLNHAGSSR